jgi:hypothetical protein
MTKVTLQYDLMRPVGDTEAEAIAKAHAVYGIVRVHLAPTLDRITVDFDASRLSEKDLESALIGVGVPVRRAPLAA